MACAARPPAVVRRPASGATFRGASRPAAAESGRPARQNRRTSQGSAAETAPRGAVAGVYRSDPSTSCRLPPADLDDTVRRLLDRRAHRAQRAMEAGLGRPERGAGAAGDLRQGHPEEVVHHDDGAPFGLEAAKRVIELIAIDDVGGEVDL